MGMCALNSKLKPMNLDLKEEFMVHLVFASLPKEFATFVVNYNSQNGGSVNFVHNNKKRLFHAASSSKAKDKALMPQKYQQQRPPAQDECFHCYDKGHRKADCPAYLKMIMTKNGENVISFVNESLYIQFSKSTWWIDSGATEHVTNSLQEFRSTRTTQRSERHIKVTNGVQADVEAVGDVSLELVNGFMLVLKDVLFVPSLQRNLISVSRLDTDGFGCHFANDKCELWFDNNCIGDAFLYNDLYLLSMRDKVHYVRDVNVNESLSQKKQRKERELNILHRNYGTVV